jgi:diaminohydroxyphosphoribosylaminopyrimidine deaminase/5-amino-6-(5-phosphoribosylamino)uracil reductase
MPRFGANEHMPHPTEDDEARAADEAAMAAALEIARTARVHTAPNPWVGAVVVDGAGDVLARGATEPPGGRHAEVVALDAVEALGFDARGTTLVTTLEPCCHHGRTPPCTTRILDAGVARVVIGLLDPDPLVAGRGVDALRGAGVEVTVGVDATAAERQLLPYLHHRRTGRPYVVCKLASTLDGATAAPDGSSQWITGEAARRDAHRLRAESDAIVVGAGTVRADDPALTVRLVDGPDPRRVVLGTAPPGARVHPCLEWTGDIDELLDHLGGDGVVQLMVEGGATVAGAFHDRGLIDRYVFYLAPALLGGCGGMPAINGSPSPSIDDLWRGRVDAIERVGHDIRIEVVPRTRDSVLATHPATKNGAT